MNNKETRICQNCKKTFVIEPSDFTFYEKIKVPPPTWCPECRMARRMMFRNERSLYKRKCDATGKDIISMYSPDKPFRVYEQKYWWSDNWDPLGWGRDFDWSKPFFEQFRKLMKEVPCNNLSVATNNINSDYVNWETDDKNCYLCFAGNFNENVAYSTRELSCKDSFDLLFVDKLERCYENVICQNSYNLFYSQHCDNCIDSWFLYDCRNCQNIFGCTGLRNKQYHIFNKPYSKNEYYKKLNEFNLGSYEAILKIKKEFDRFKLSYPRKFANLNNTYEVTGDNVIHTKNSKFIFDGMKEIENSKFVFWGLYGLKDSYDVLGAGATAELIYDSIASGMSGSRILFSVVALGCHSVFYSINCHHSSHLFGCIGLRNKQYCILNKQYTKEEYERLVPKIIEHMNEMPYIDKKGRIYKYGEFFPPELSPFAYNETIAQEYFPLTKKQALEQGYPWKEPEERNIQFSIPNSQLPDNIKDVKDDIVGQIIECAHQGKCNEQCTEVFKIIPQELQFYRKMNLPLPRLCPNCRHYQRLKQRNPLKLWKRKCMCGGSTSTNGVYKNTVSHFHGKESCPNEFETTYSPDRPEIVYCEECYLREVV